MRLIKKKLEALPVPCRSFNVDKHFEVKAESMAYEGGSIVVATIWYSKNEEPTYRVFIADNSYITQMHKGDIQWSTSKIFNHVTGMNYCYWNRRAEQYKVYADEATISLLKDRAKLCGVEDDALWLINYIQSKIRMAKIEKQEREEQARWDAVLDTTPDMPTDFTQWLIDKVFTKERYILYETTRSKIKRGKCTYCRQEVEVTNPHHGHYTTCPSCGVAVRLKNGNKQKYIQSERNECILAQMTSLGKVVLREYRVSQTISVENWQDFEVKHANWELERIFINKNREVDKYIWGVYKNKKTRFVQAQKTHGYSVHMHYGRNMTYMDGYEEIVIYLGCGMEYLPEEIFEREVGVYNMIKQPYIAGIAERLWKRGLKNLATDVTGKYMCQMTEKAMFKYFKVENDDICILKATDIKMSELECWPKIKKTGKRPTAEDIAMARTIGCSLDDLAELCQYASIGKMLRYLQKQCQSRPIGTYKDYLSMLKELHMDIKSDFNLFPNNLVERHDELVELKNEQANVKLKRKLDKSHSVIAKMEDTLNERFGVENKNCFIRAPHSAYEIALEGQKLHHCVGGDIYRDKMKKGESFILFVRKKESPDEPWWTIEVGNNNNIMQYHGWGNKDKDKDDVEPIMKIFRRRLEKLKAEDAKREAISAAV